LSHIYIQYENFIYLCFHVLIERYKPKEGFVIALDHKWNRHQRHNLWDRLQKLKEVWTKAYLEIYSRALEQNAKSSIWRL